MTTAPTTTSTHRGGRRSAHKRDPIVAPGGGTRRDLEMLSKELELPVEAVIAIMEAKGRGIRGIAEEDLVDPQQQQQQQWASDDYNTREEDVVEKATEEEHEEEDVVEEVAPSTSASTSSSSRNYKLPLKLETANTDGGILVQAGTLDSAIVGRTKRTMDRLYDCMTPSRLPLSSSSSVKVTRVIAGCNAAHALAITAQGQVYGWGRNEAQQLGLSSDDQPNVMLPTLLEGAPMNVVNGAVGKSHTLLLDGDYQVWAVGYNKFGQCSIRMFTETIPNWRKCVLPSSNVEIVKVACGEHFSVALDTDGYLYTTGSSEYGQLANGETGQYFVTASKLAFANCNMFTRRTNFCHVKDEVVHKADSHAKVVSLEEQDDVRLGDLACGKHHVVALEAPSLSKTKRRVFTWGCGDYGCLGHGLQKDEYYPRLVKTSTLHIPTCQQVAAGSHCSMMLTQDKKGHVYYWGKHKSAGEATMRPTVVDALANNGHVVTHMSGGAFTVVCCTKSGATVSWGQGPHGELGYGPEKKSSSKPNFVSALDTCRMLDMKCGQGMTLYVVEQSDEQDKAAIEKLPKIDAGSL